DFIDMESAENREKVFRLLKNELKKDKAKTKVLPISEIGLVEMTRKRNRENLGRYLRIQCPYCDGSARILSPSSIIYEIFREIARLASGPKPPQNLLLGLHSDIGGYLEVEEIETYRSMERLIKGTISLQTSDKFHYEQFELLEL
ncbi:MAG: ribonuclease E/G, partial [SAR324 cluster bacterium]|nr:ribonuclease E/G [SAR324 cluster bacterium]